jgi:hypothetical protein
MPSEPISTVFSEKDGDASTNSLSTANDTVRLSVTWGREDLPPHVNLITQVLYVDESENGRSTTWEPHLSWSLDREDINKLIRVLRRARNAVFGQDE